MRDVLFSLLIIGLLPVIYRRAFIGLLLFSWLAYMRPQDLCWGFARPQRWSFLVAAVTMAGYLSRPRGQFYVRDPRTHAMILMIVLVGIGCVLGGENSVEQFNKYIEFVKIIGVALFTTSIVSTPDRLRVIIWVIAMCFGFYGVKLGLAGVLSGGQLEILNGPGGMLEDNNDFSLAMVMALPMLVHIGTSEKRKVLRRGVFLMVPLTALTVVMTHSRGGFLAMMTALGVLVWRSRNRLAGIFLGIAALVIAYIVVPASYIERIQSISHYEDDGSARGRLQAWDTAIRMATAHPVFGVGYTMFRRNYQKYSATPGQFARVAHNSYLQIWAESGTIAILVYLFLFFYTLYRLWRVSSVARRYYNASWIISYATMFEATLVSFIIGSTFLNRAQFDLAYHFIGIVVAFEVIAYREIALLQKRPDARMRTVAVGEQRKAQGFGAGPRKRGFRDRPALGGAD